MPAAAACKSWQALTVTRYSHPGRLPDDSTLPEIAVQLQEDFLGSVLGILHAAQQAQRRHQHQPLVLAHELFERRQVARLRGRDDAGAVVLLFGRPVHGSGLGEERQGSCPFYQ